MHPSVFPALNELRAFKHTQMFRHGGKRHFVRRGKIADGCFALREPREDASASGIAKRGKRAIKRRLIVNHMVYY